MARAKKGFQNVLRSQVTMIERRGGKTAGGKTIRNPKAYIASGLRKTGIRKYGQKGFAARQKQGHAG